MKGEMRVYLGGAIRRLESGEVDPRDIEWRSKMTDKLDDMFIQTIDPIIINNETVESLKTTMEWTREQLQTVGKNDCAAMDACNIGVFNFLAFEEDYPMVGSLMETGYMTAQEKCIIIISSNERLRQNPMLSMCFFVDTPDDVYGLLRPIYLKDVLHLSCWQGHCS